MSAYPPGSLFNPGWFRVPSGDHAGEVILSGWFLSAISTDYGWVSVGSCPICGAAVMGDRDKDRDSQMRKHEQWHARTDLPIPPELADP